MKSSREQFEVWVKEETGFDLCRTNYPMTEWVDQKYESYQTYLAWMAWQASREAIEITLPDCDDYRTTWQYQDAAEIKIKELGLTVK